MAKKGFEKDGKNMATGIIVSNLIELEREFPCILVYWWIVKKNRGRFGTEHG